MERSEGIEACLRATHRLAWQSTENSLAWSTEDEVILPPARRERGTLNL